MRCSPCAKKGLGFRVGLMLKYCSSGQQETLDGVRRDTSMLCIVNSSVRLYHLGVTGPMRRIGFRSGLGFNQTVTAP